ncbi:MAG: carboxypeptidase regulatory-like domain-containing protein [Fibrobacter sp.]|nr:carboxypeptidase regulatory-like domain-containing protein [Fibrobacter sp.]
MMRLVKCSFAFLMAVGMSLVACSDDKDNGIAGTVTDTGNTIATAPEVAGVVLRTDGAQVSKATVRMARILAKSDSFKAPEYIETETDSLGAFAFDSALADTFQLAVIDTESSEVSYLPRTTVGSGDFDSLKLEKAAVFSSVLYYEEGPEPTVAVGSHFKVFLKGTPFYQSVFAGDSFSMLIPAGTWSFSFSPGDPQIVSKLEDNGVEDTLIFRSWKMDAKVKAGDTLTAGPFIWSPSAEPDSLIKVEEKILENKARISGTVYCDSAEACADVEVQLITDLYGFDSVDNDSAEFKAQTQTDSRGRWYLPVPDTVPYDSFRVEYRFMKKGEVTRAGLSRYVKASELKKIDGDTLSIGKTTLSEPSSLNSGVILVIDKRDSSQSNNCMVNSVVVGIKGTSHFVREVTCNMLEMSDLPSGKQDIVLYSGDNKVVKTLREAKTPLDDFVTITHVALPTGESLDQQWMTYTPPTVNTPGSLK